jgi:hypothetical protein
MSAGEEHLAEKMQVDPRPRKPGAIFADPERRRSRIRLVVI